MKDLDEDAIKRLNDFQKKADKEFQQLQKELEKEGYHFSKGGPPPGMKTDPMNQVMDQIQKKLPNLIDSFFNREKRIELKFKLTAEEAMRLTEFMVKDGMGKTQVMEEP